MQQDYAQREKRNYLYSFKRREMFRQAIGITLVGVMWAVILFIGIGGEL